jgi:hypothetical protein
MNKVQQKANVSEKKIFLITYGNKKYKELQRAAATQFGSHTLFVDS